MNRNMHAKTIALVLAAITGMQAGGIGPKFAGINVKAYASEVKEANEAAQVTESCLNYDGTGINVTTTTAGAVTVNLPNNFTENQSLKLETLKNGSESTAFIGIKLKTPIGIDLSSVAKVNENGKAISLEGGNYIKYIAVATKGDKNWMPVNNNNTYKYEWLNNKNEVLKNTSLNIVVKSEKYATVSISGSEKVGKTLEANVTAYKNGRVTTPVDVNYEWKRCKKKDGDYDRITSGKDNEYKLKSSDEDKYIKVIASVNIEGEVVNVEGRTGEIDDRRSSGSHHSSSSKGSGSTADTDRISDKIEDSRADNISYDVSDYPKVEKDVFKCLKDNDDKTLTLEGDDYSWTFDGDDIDNVSEMDSKLDTTIETTSPNASEIKNVLNGASVVNLYFNYDGKLPGKAKIEMKIGSKYNGKNMYVYYYNKNTKSLELVSSDVKVKDDKISFTITHCSDYVLSETPLLNTANFKEGWNTLNNGNWQYVLGGNRVTGWNFINGRWYYMDSLGMMQRGWVTTNGSWYYLNYNGDMATGWQNINGKWYYLRGDGKMLTGWIDDKGTWYYLDYSGAMVSNAIINGYRLGSNGAWIR